jgi:AbrB family looped-hinge helix DNA binding protein
MPQREIVMTMTRKGQVTIPAVIREMLGLEPNKQVAFEIEAGEVKIKRARATLEAAYGAVKPLARPEDFEAIAEIAHEEHARQAAATSG